MSHQLEARDGWTICWPRVIDEAGYLACLRSIGRIVTSRGIIDLHGEPAWLADLRDLAASVWIAAYSILEPLPWTALPDVETSGIPTELGGEVASWRQAIVRAVEGDPGPARAWAWELVTVVNLAARRAGLPVVELQDRMHGMPYVGRTEWIGPRCYQRTESEDVHIVCPHTEIHPATAAALELAEEAGFVVERISMLNDESYWHLFRRLWSEQRTVIVVEHDNAPSVAALHELAACSGRWCCVAYQYLHEDFPATTSLGCAKFSGDLMRHWPQAPDAWAEWLNGRHWYTQDRGLNLALAARGEVACAHSEVRHAGIEERRAGRDRLNRWETVPRAPGCN